MQSMHLLATPHSPSPEQLQEAGFASHLQSSPQTKPSLAQSESESQSQTFCKVPKQIISDFFAVFH